MGQTTIILMILTIISKIFGFVRESVMAAFIGAGELKSIYTTSMTIPNVLTWIVSTGIISSYIPIYNKVINEKGEKAGNEFTSNLINIALIYSLIAFIIVFIFAKPISKIFSPQLSGDELVLATNFTRIIIFAIFAFMYSSIIRGFLNIKDNFIDPLLTGFILNIITILATLLTAKLRNPYILIIGALIANIFQYIRYPFVSKKLGFKYQNILNFKDEYIKMFMVLIIPIMISSAVDQISLLIDNSMASAFFGIESVSKIFYAKTMLNFIMGVVTLSVTTVTFPEIAKAGQSGELNVLRSKISSAIVFSMLLVIPATFGMMVLSNPIIKLAFERSAFTNNDTIMVSSLLIYYAPYIIFTSLIKILANGFYSIGDSKTPVIIVLIQQIINILLNIILVNFVGVNGIGLATSLSTAIGCILLVLAFNKKVCNVDRIGNFNSLSKIIISTIIMSFIVKFIYVKSNLYSAISLLLSVLIGGLTYLVIIKFMKINEVDIIILEIKKKINELRDNHN